MKVWWQSFFWKTLAVLLLVLSLLGGANIIQTRSVMHDMFIQQQEKRGVSLANMLSARAANLILVQNYYDLHELVKDTESNNDDVLYAFVVNNEEEILAHSFTGGFPKDLLAANRPDKMDKFHIVELETEKGRVQDIAVPIFEGRLGLVRIGLGSNNLQAMLAETTRQIMLDALAAALLGICLTVFLTRRLTMPIRDLVRVTNSITAGDFTQRVHASAEDEIGKLGKTFNAMADHVYRLLSDLKQKEEARSHLLQKVIVAQEEERKRIARELHDETGQTLTSLMMGLKYLSEHCPGNQQQCQLTEMRNTVKRTLDEIHRLSVELRPSILDDMGLVPALEKYVADYRATYQIDADVHVTWRWNRRLPREVEVAVYRIIQEALTNVAKYAQAKNVSVILACDERGMEAIIEDDGVGFAADELMQESATGNKLGLYGMRERAEVLGGAVKVESSVGVGTTIFLRIPLQRGDNDEPN
ncbi:MAG: histidine kinase [Anaerosporomusa subterranea]|jgi:signal transduction histidine kinase|nr:histidine kinase [Anaerosporomusa subterranea]